MSANVGPVYNHRPMQPTTVRPNATPGDRPSLFDSLDTIKNEYKSLYAELEGVRNERDELEVKLKSQMAELNSVRSALYELEIHHSRVLAKYEEETHQLHAERSNLRYELGKLPETPFPTFVRHPPSSSEPFDLPGSADPPGRPTSSRIDRPQSSSSLGRVDGLKGSRPSEGDSNRNSERFPDFRESKRHKSGKDHPDSYPQLLMGAQSQNASSSGSAKQLPSPNALGLHRSPEVPTPREPAERELPERDQVHKDLPRHAVPPEIVNDKKDWQVVYNPRIAKALDIGLVHTFNHSSVVCCIRFSPDGKLLATGCKSSTHLYNVQTGTKICVLSDPEPQTPRKGPQTKDYYIRSVKFSPDGKLLATGSEDNEIRIWDIDARKIVRTLKGHTEEIYSLDFSKNGRYIVSGSADKTMWIWDLHEQTSQMIYLSKDSQNFEQGITSISISPDSKLVAAGCMDTIVRIYDIETVELVDTLQGHDNSVYSVSFTHDGRGLITGSLDKQLKLWDITPILQNITNPLSASVQRRRYPIANCPCVSFKGHNDFVLSTSITPDCRWIISGSKDRSVSFWDARNADLQFTLQGHKNSVIALHTSPLGGMFATGSGDATARIWTFSSA